jgi:hypothetical protein
VGEGAFAALVETFVETRRFVLGHALEGNSAHDAQQLPPAGLLAEPIQQLMFLKMKNAEYF